MDQVVLVVCVSEKLFKRNEVTKDRKIIKIKKKKNTIFITDPNKFTLSHE